MAAVRGWAELGPVLPTLSSFPVRHRSPSPRSWLHKSSVLWPWPGWRSKAKATAAAQAPTAEEGSTGSDGSGTKLKEEERAFNMAEKTNYLLFMMNAFQSLDDELVRETMLQLVSLMMWNTLSFGQLQMELCLNPELIMKCTKIKRREAKEAKKADQPTNPSEMFENKFLRNLIE